MQFRPKIFILVVFLCIKKKMSMLIGFLVHFSFQYEVLGKRKPICNFLLLRVIVIGSGYFRIMSPTRITLILHVINSNQFQRS